MFRDRVEVWVLEYIFGGILAVVPMTGLLLWRDRLVDGRLWSAGLFVVCLGVILIACASSMRRRMLLAKRIEKLAEQMADKRDRE